MRMLLTFETGKSLALDVYAANCFVVVVLLVCAARSQAASTVWTGPAGGDFLSDTNWTLAAPGEVDSAIFNNDFDGTVVFSDSITTQDLFLRSTSGTIDFDVDPSALGNKYTMSRFTIVGAAAGETNHMRVSSGNLETGIILIGNAAGAENNLVDVRGSDTYWNATGGTAGTAAIRVGSNGGSNSTLMISGGAEVESQTQTIIGLQGASNNLLVVTGEGSTYRNAQSISLGDNIAPEIPSQTNNQLQVLDHGFITTRELIIGTTAKSPDNTVTVSGSGSRLNVRGGQQSPPTEGGQRHDVGRASSNNKLLIEEGGAVDGNAIFLLGREETSLNNLLSVTDGSLAGWGIEIRQGTLLIDNGMVEITRAFDHLANQFLGGSLLAETPQAVFDFRSGRLATVNANVANGQVFTIGDGMLVNAEYHMKTNPQTEGNDVHRFADGVALAANGILSGNGNIVGNVSGTSGAMVDVGDSAGVINVTGDWNNTGLNVTLELDDIAASTAPGEQFDELAIEGLFTHGGSVTIDLFEYVAPASPQQLKLVGWESESGPTSSTLVSFVGGSPLPISFQSDGLYVTAEMISILAGDYNENGVVDAADYTVWRDNLGTTYPLANDPLGGTIGAEHYNQWLDHFGDTADMGAGSFSSFSVPEPAAGVLLSAAGVLVQFVLRRMGRPVTCGGMCTQSHLGKQITPAIRRLRAVPGY